MSKWIDFEKSRQNPKHEEDILYVVDGSDHSGPFVVRGMRCYDGNDWWWCDEDGEYSEIGNDGECSYVTLWMRIPKIPLAAQRPGGEK